MSIEDSIIGTKKKWVGRKIYDKLSEINARI